MKLSMFQETQQAAVQEHQVFQETFQEEHSIIYINKKASEKNGGFLLRCFLKQCWNI